MTYLWRETVNMPEFKQLEGDHETEVLIIGGGLTGLLCSYMLGKSGVGYMLAEAETVGSGTASGTTAVLTAQHSDIYTKITKKYGKETAKGYLDANLNAVEKYRELSKKFDFDFCDKDSYIYSTEDKRKLEVEAAVVKELGFAAEYEENTELPMETAGAVRFPGMAQMNPLKLAARLAENANIYEHTRITKVKNNTAYFEKGTVKAGKIIIATRFPIINTSGLYPIKLYQKRSFVVALENAPVLKGSYADISDRGIYMRNYGGLLIIGGGDCRTAARNDGFTIVREFADRYFPETREKYAWAAQDCMSLDGIPYIGAYSKSLPDVYVASGFNEWGMSSAMAAASVICDEITDRENEYRRIFSPDRGILTRQTAVNAAETIVNFLYPGTKRCSHLGCSLKKNQQENTWDCPCHGSRFDHQGQLIDGPATRDML